MNLNFKPHTTTIGHKISRSIGNISKVRHYLLKKALFKFSMLVFTLTSYMDF